jgi:(p)ppGpp synthase/HD superfamily hydrolase
VSSMERVPPATNAPTFLRGLPLAFRAYEFARRAHGAQRRASDAARFIVHPLEVAALLHNSGHSEAVVAAGVLHDTVEDTGLAMRDILREFGPEISRIVVAMTEDPAIADFHDRKRALREQIAGCGPDASAVYAADKVAKVREFRSRATRGETVLDPENRPAHERLEHYLHSLETLEQITPDHPLVRQLRFELEVLHALPPRPDLLDTGQP